MSHAKLISLTEPPDHPREACGVVGIWGNNTGISAATLCYLGLYALQHRGQESAGIATADGERVQLIKGMGLVPEVFDQDRLNELPGHIGIGHVRYSTTGSSQVTNAQPLLVRCSFGSLGLAHNGNLVNVEKLRQKLMQRGSVFQTTTDSEVILNLVAQHSNYTLPEAVTKALREVAGGYALVIMSRNALLAARDPLGIRPLCLGRLNEGYIVASESCAIDNLGGQLIREIQPGELIMIDSTGLHSYTITASEHRALCVFEYIYFARPDSCIAGKNAYLVRKAIGRQLALENPVDADIVMGAPDSGTSAALGFAETAGIPFETGLIKNRYVGRTFIQPHQASRNLGVRIKLNPVKEVLAGKRVVVIDDSIVRGTTSGRLVSLLRQAGAREVHMYVASPPYRYPCYYGIDTSSQGELIAGGRTEAEIQEFIGADTLHYISVAGLVKAVGIPANQLCLACFTGKYPVPPPECPLGKDVLEVD